MRQLDRKKINPVMITGRVRLVHGLSGKSLLAPGAIQGRLSVNGLNLSWDYLMEGTGCHMSPTWYGLRTCSTFTKMNDSYFFTKAILIFNIWRS